MNIVFLDLETTGRDENKHGVIEIAARYDEDRETKAIFYKKFFDEKASVNLEALKVNNTAYGSLESLGHEDVAVSAFVDFLDNSIAETKCPAKIVSKINNSLILTDQRKG